VLLEFSLNGPDTQTIDELIIQDADGKWTTAYLELVTPFYPWA
jgi:hypothetical protein